MTDWRKSMNDAGESSEVKKRKGPSASYQKSRRDAIKAGTWNPRFRRLERRDRGMGTNEAESSIPGPSSEAAEAIQAGE